MIEMCLSTDAGSALRCTLTKGHDGEHLAVVRWDTALQMRARNAGVDHRHKWRRLVDERAVGLDLMGDTALSAVLDMLADIERETGMDDRESVARELLPSIIAIAEKKSEHGRRAHVLSSDGDPYPVWWLFEWENGFAMTWEKLADRAATWLNELCEADRG